jgi:hypothetical protein
MVRRLLGAERLVEGDGGGVAEVGLHAWLTESSLRWPGRWGHAGGIVSPSRSYAGRFRMTGMATATNTRKEAA